MNGQLGIPLAPELAVFALAVLVLIAGLVRPGRAIGWIAFAGLIGIFGLLLVTPEGQVLFGGGFVQDALALFSKRLFVGATALSVLGSLTIGHASFDRRSSEYHFAMLVSLLGMLVLASARELILLFVAFELMSIPLYVLTGFLKRDAVAPEAALKFFLVGTVSSAVIAYGMSFIYGATGGTALSMIPQAMRDGHPIVLLGMGLLLAGLGFKIAAFPFHMWAPDSYEAASTPFVDANSRHACRHDDRHRQSDGDPAAEHQAAARLLRRRSHRLYADRRRGGVESRRRDAAVLSARLPVWKHGRVHGR
jgi:NADH-quinone oxidoreductase subunit N